VVQAASALMGGVAQIASTLVGRTGGLVAREAGAVEQPHQLRRSAAAGPLEDEAGLRWLRPGERGEAGEVEEVTVSQGLFNRARGRARLAEDMEALNPKPSGDLAHPELAEDRTWVTEHQSHEFDSSTATCDQGEAGNHSTKPLVALVFLLSSLVMLALLLGGAFGVATNVWKYGQERPIRPNHRRSRPFLRP